MIGVLDSLRVHCKITVPYRSDVELTYCSSILSHKIVIRYKMELHNLNQKHKLQVDGQLCNSQSDDVIPMYSVTVVTCAVLCCCIFR